MAYILMMASSLHILRRKPIELSELRAVLAQLPVMRGPEASGAPPFSAANDSPLGAVRSCAATEASLPLPGFRYAEGALHFTADFDLADSRHPIRVMASLLACLLDATIIGDDGQIYRW